MATSGFIINVIPGMMLIVLGLMTAILAYPLVKRKVGMNHAYGVRLPQSFYSEESWYELNEYGGKLMMRWGVLIAIAGGCLAFVPVEGVLVSLLIVIVLIASSLLPVAFMYRYAKKFRPAGK